MTRVWSTGVVQTDEACDCCGCKYAVWSPKDTCRKPAGWSCSSCGAERLAPGATSHA